MSGAAVKITSKPRVRRPNTVHFKEACERLAKDNRIRGGPPGASQDPRPAEKWLWSEIQPQGDTR